MSLGANNTISHRREQPVLPRNWDILCFPPCRCPAWRNWFLMILLSTPDDQLLPLHLEIVCHLMWNISGRWCGWKLCTSHNSSLTSITKIGHPSCMVAFISHWGLMYLWLTDYQRMHWLPEYALCPCLISYLLVCCWGGKKSITAASLYFRNSKFLWQKFAQSLLPPTGFVLPVL